MRKEGGKGGTKELTRAGEGGEDENKSADLITINLILNMTIKTNEMIILGYHNLQLYTGDD